MTLVKNLLADSHQLDADNSRNRENLHVDDILEFGRIILVVAGGLSLAIVVRVAAARIGLPTAALLLTVAALASDLSDRLATLLSFQDVQRVATLALIAILFDGGMGIGLKRFRTAAVPITIPLEES